MTDQQRGAYTPQQEVPLQFDPRATASRRPLPMALIASATLLVVLMAAVAMYFSRGVRGENEPPRPVGAPVASLKAAPAAGAQPTDAATSGPDVSAAAATTGGAKVPSFAAGPEQPLPRPSASAERLTVQTLQPAPSAAAPTGAKLATAAPAPVAAPVAAPRQALAPTPAPAPDGGLGRVATQTAPAPRPLRPEPLATPRTSVASVRTAAPATPALKGGSVGAAKVQIGAFSSQALAAKGFSDVAGLIPGALSGRGRDVEPVVVGAHTLYRASVAGFPSRAAAEAFCETLKAKGKICFVKS